MRLKKRKSESRQTPDETLLELHGAKLLHTLRGHESDVINLACDPDGQILASASEDHTIKLWEFGSGQIIRTLTGHTDEVWTVAFDPRGETLASSGADGTVKFWSVGNGRLIHMLDIDQPVHSLAFDPKGRVLAIGSRDGVMLWEIGTEKPRPLQTNESMLRYVGFDSTGELLASGSDENELSLFEVPTGRLLRTLDEGYMPLCVAFDPRQGLLATAGLGREIKLWNPRTRTLVRTLEGHTDFVDIITFSPDGRLLASKSQDKTIRLWNCETWEPVLIIHQSERSGFWSPALVLHPTLPLLASNQSQAIVVWELDYDVLLSQSARPARVPHAVHHTTAKIVLVGDHSVGKSALGHRLIYSNFEKQESTHGQKFWVFPALGKQRSDGTDCEAVLWDFAGQPDYRLVHALFLDNADLALLLFDASDIHDPLHGVEFWLKQLRATKSSCPIILVAARVDRGSSSLTTLELKAFCRQHGIAGPIATSAVTGEGISDLIEAMKNLTPWDDKATTVTTATFKQIKDYVLGLKETGSESRVLVTDGELRALMEATDAEWQFTDDEMLTAVGHLENYGYVKRVRTSTGEHRILVQPERLNNLASSFVLEARRNQKGLGALEEQRLFDGGYEFPELKDLDRADGEVLLDSAALLFLEHNVCFREIDPLRMERYLMFPELINLKKPVEEDAATEDGVAYTVSGPTENVCASLVVLLGYTHMFTRTAQWQNNARYEVGDGLVCGFRQEAERDGDLDFVLCFAPNVGGSVRTLFQGLFESLLSRRNVTVRRYEPVCCSKSHIMNRTVVREALQQGDSKTFCSKCGEQLTLPLLEEPIQLTQDQQFKVESQRRSARKRTRFEQAVFRLRSFVAEQNITPPTCFISYAWGVPEHERWVEKRLARDLQKGGIEVLLDRWHNAQIGASIPRFIERIEESDCVVVVGTPQYKQKAKNVVSMKGSVVAAEYDLAGIRLLSTEDEKRTVLPILLEGDESESFPALLRGRVYGDFRNEEAYFTIAFDLILSIYQLPLSHSAVADLREFLTRSELMLRLTVR
jgi:small GTP-binding protein